MAPTASELLVVPRLYRASRPTSHSWGILLLALGVSSVAACGDEAGADGASCGADSQCESSFCYAARCMDPDADDDGDGLANRQEAALGTDPLAGDSDGDGVADGVEVGDDPAAPRDSDGDWDQGNSLHDANESAIADADGDCIADQFDAANTTAQTDPEVLAAVACRHAGVCVSEGAQVSATCDTELVCDYSAVPGWDGELEVTCDGLDNDCDGAVDEGLVWTDAGGVVLAIGAQCAGISGCVAREGVVECGPTGKTLCSADPGGSDFVATTVEIPCNGLDDDCDGVTDNGAALELADGTVLHAGDPCTAAGLCGKTPGVVECGAAGDGTAVCSSGPGGSNDQSAPESCDAADNDCDGEIDEGLSWESPSGASILVGGACGVGLCEGASVRCRAGTAVCCRPTAGGDCEDLEALAEPETCDGVDNDCDGETDEDQDVAAGCDAPGLCATSPPSAGVCNAQGVLVCTWEGVEGYEPLEVSCNGIDDDCDGLVDEGVTTADGLGLGQACAGKGACAGEGQVVCDPAPSPGTTPGAVCSADLGGAVEWCNGVDDDCDGETDEGVDVSGLPEAEALDCPELGVCASFVGSTAQCVDGAVACAAAANSFYEATEVSCDTQDNDCDGLVDEATAKLFTTAVSAFDEGQPPERAAWTGAADGAGGVWVFGGMDGPDGPLSSDLWRLEGSTGVWERRDAGGGPVARHRHALAWEPVYGVLLVHGGAVAGAGMPLSGLFAYSPQEDSWQPVVQTGLAPAADEPAQLPTRERHSLTALGDGTVLLHGGVAADELAPTLRGTLAEDETGQLTCAWAEATALAASRVGHVGVLWTHDGASEVALVGGSGLGAEGAFAEVLDLDAGTDWVALGDTKEQLAPRTGHVVVADGSRLVVLGGRSVAEDPAMASPLGDAWVYDAADPGPSWQALAAPSALTALDGAVAWSSALGLHVAGGVTESGATSRVVWTLPPGSSEWEPAAPWAGPLPRIGGTLVVRPDTGETFLMAGTRRAGKWPLMDVWRRDPGGAWTLELAPVAPSGGPFGQTRPATAGAAAAWDPVNQRLLLYGGWDAGTGEPSDVLWAYDPSAGQFSQPDAQGAAADIPSGPLLCALGVDGAGGEAWLLGSYEVAGAGGAEQVLAVHRLDLSTTSWSLAWTGPAGDPGELAFLAGGVGPAGLRAVTQSVGSKALRMWAWDSGSQSLVSQGAPTAPVFDVALGGAYDRWSDRTGVVVDSVGLGGVHLVQLVHATGTVPGPLPAGGLSAELSGAAWVVHPSDGLVAFGGETAGGAGRSESVTVDQKCAPP